MVAAVANRVKWTAYCKLVLLQVWKESRKNLLSTIVAAISAALAAYLQFRFYVVPFSTNIPKLLTSFEASLIVLFAYFLVFFFRAPWLLHNQALEDQEKKQGEIRLLQAQLETPALKAEIISTAIKTERISNYVSSAFPTGGYFGLRIVIELRISNDGRVPSLATVTPSLTKGEQDFSARLFYQPSRSRSSVEP